MVIRVDNKKCLGAENCGKCLHICTLGVFMNVPLGKFNSKKPPEKYIVVPYFRNVCNRCMACLNICPEKCIEFDVSTKEE